MSGARLNLGTRPSSLESKNRSAVRSGLRAASGITGEFFTETLASQVSKVSAITRSGIARANCIRSVQVIFFIMKPGCSED